jgi:hypothetical protein
MPHCQVVTTTTRTRRLPQQHSAPQPHLSVQRCVQQLAHAIVLHHMAHEQLHQLPAQRNPTSIRFFRAGLYSCAQLLRRVPAELHNRTRRTQHVSFGQRTQLWEHCTAAGVARDRSMHSIRAAGVTAQKQPTKQGMLVPSTGPPGPLRRRSPARRSSSRRWGGPTAAGT